MTERVGDDGSVSGISWASVFDPAVNIRALGEIQARGFRAATEVVNRFVRMAEARSDADSVERQQSPSEPSTPAPDVDRLLEMWQRLATRAVESLRDVAQPPSAHPSVDIERESADGVVALVVGETGAAATEVWLHNAGAADLGKVRLHCSDLLAHDGAVIPSSTVGFEPDAVPMVPRCSRGVTVQIDVPDDVAPGHYRGTLLADGYPDIWMPVIVTVLPRAT